MLKGLIAILRGITPHQVEAVADVLVDAGIPAIEVPLNSPEPYASIRKLVERYAGKVHIGAGTVLTTEQVNTLGNLGGQLVVTPNCNPEVISAAIARDMTVISGVFTPTDCFAAIAAGASALKFFPAELVGTKGFKAIHTVLPSTTPCFAVGGITPESIAPWCKAGIDGFGLGSALYKAGDTPDQVRTSAQAFVTAWRATQDRI